MARDMSANFLEVHSKLNTEQQSLYTCCHCLVAPFAGVDEALREEETSDGCCSGQEVLLLPVPRD